MGSKVRKNEEAGPNRPEQVCGSSKRGRLGTDASRKGRATSEDTVILKGRNQERSFPSVSSVWWVYVPCFHHWTITEAVIGHEFHSESLEAFSY